MVTVVEVDTGLGASVGDNEVEGAPVTGPPGNSPVFPTPVGCKV
jgi:hypothetical protein